MKTPDLTLHWHERMPSALIDRLQAVPHALQQSYGYGEAARAFGVQVMHGVIEQDGAAIAVIQLLIKKRFGFIKIGSAMRGPVWLQPIADEIKRSCFALLRHQSPLRWPHLMLWMPEEVETTLLANTRLTRVISGYATVMMDLTQSTESLLAAMDGKWRNRLKAAQQSDVTVQPVDRTAEAYGWLLEQEAAQSHRIGYSALSPDFVPLYQRASGKDALLILSAQSGNETIAAVLMLLHGKTATYHIGWSNEQGKASGAHNLLLWDAMQRLKKYGIEQLDLGGVNTQDGAGIARFKIGLGGKVVKLVGSYV